MQTQRVEARQQRRDDEQDRRNLQQRVRSILAIGREKRELAKNISKQFLRSFKRDTLQCLQDLGCLRSRKEYSLGTHFIPLLYTQADLETKESADRTKLFDQQVATGLSLRANRHKQAILAHEQKLEDEKNEKIRQEDDARKAKERR